MVIAEAARIDLARAAAGGYAANATVVDEWRQRVNEWRQVEWWVIDGWHRIDGRVFDGWRGRKAERRP